jgi:hypothetical protein
MHSADAHAHNGTIIQAIRIQAIRKEARRGPLRQSLEPAPQLMSNIPKDRFGAAVSVCQLWKDLPAEQLRCGWTDEELRSREEKVLTRLAELCWPEILEAIVENQAEAGVCGISYITTADGREGDGGEGLAAIYRGVRRVAGTNKRPSNEHVKACVSQVLQEEASEEAASLRKLKPRGVLTKLASFSPLRADWLIDHLSRRQQRELRLLLYRELGNKTVPLRMDQKPNLNANSTPKQRRYQLFWYLWRLRITEPDVRRALGGVPRIVVIGDGDGIITNKKTGMPSDPLGPIHAKMWQGLGRELNKHLHPIKDPESKNKNAKSVGVSRSTLQRYLGDGPWPKLTPDGKGGLYTKYTLDDFVEALEKSSQRKRNKRKSEG